VASVYGAAGSLIVLLLWVYYSAQLVFFGAEFTKVYSRRFGAPSMTPRVDVPAASRAGGSSTPTRRLIPGERAQELPDRTGAKGWWVMYPAADIPMNDDAHV
jgi:hypothetical protein